MTTTRKYDRLERLTETAATPSGAPASSTAYQYNAANQRTQARLADGSFWAYRYDGLGQVTNAAKYWADNTVVAGQQFGYAFDNIGNRTCDARRGVTRTGPTSRTATYWANNLNQYTNRTVPGYADILGLGFATNGISVNGQAAYRKGEYFRDQVSVNNSNGPVWQIAEHRRDQRGHGEQQPVRGAGRRRCSLYDADGNLTNDGRWSYTWDAENRLVGMAANTAVGPTNSLRFTYDWQGRRIRKQVWPNATQTGNPTNDVAFLYDLPAVASAEGGGWNLVAEVSVLNGQQASLIRAYAGAWTCRVRRQGRGAWAVCCG